MLASACMVGGCTLFLGLDNRDFDGAGGADASAGSEAQKGSSGIVTATGSGGGCAPAVSGPGGSAVWAKSFDADVAATVNAIAALSCGDVAITGSFHASMSLGGDCGKVTTMADDAGFVAVLDALDGRCKKVVVLQPGCVAAGCSLVPHAIAITPSQGVVIAGDVFGPLLPDQNPNLSLDGFAYGFDSGLMPQWTTEFKSDGSDSLTGVAVADNGVVYVAGYVSGTVRWLTQGTGSQFQTLTPRGSKDGFIASLSEVGVPVWAHLTGSESDDDFRALVLDRTTGEPTVYAVGNSGIGMLMFDGAAGPSNDTVAGFLAVRYSLGGGFLEGIHTRASKESAGEAVAYGGAKLVQGGAYSGMGFSPGPTLPDLAATAWISASDGAEGTLTGADQGIMPNVIKGIGADPTGVVVGGQFLGHLTPVDLVDKSTAYDAFVVALGPSLDPTMPQWKRSFGDVGDDRVLTVAMVPSRGAVAVAGSFTGSLDFGGGKSADSTPSKQSGFVALLVR